MNPPNDVLAEWEAKWENVVADWQAVRRQPVPESWAEEWGKALTSYQALVADRKWLRGPRSIMEVLRVQHLEIPHSQMLAWFLDPSGGHGLGDSVLRAVLDVLRVKHRRADLALARVRREVWVDTRPEPGSIDLLVEWPGGTLLIENKVWSSVHGTQLVKYAEAYQGATRVFLAPQRTTPTEVERGGTKWDSLGWVEDLIPMFDAIARQARALDHPCPALEDYLVTLRKEMSR